MNYKKKIIFFLFFLIGSIAAWDYKDVESWKDEFPQCGGKQQSPINLDQIDLFDDVAEELNLQSYHIKPVKMALSNNGHTLELKPEWDDAFGPPTITVQGIEYQLQSLHFHWGLSNDNGSEHIFVHDLRTSLEMHIVHYNPEFGDFDNKNGDAILVVGIIFEIGKYSNALWEILDNAYQVQEPESAVVEIEPFPISDFLNENSFNYYISYNGSLTTPPCSEGVTWIVLIPLMEVSALQMEVFRSIKLNHEDDHNNRPVQPINDRTPGKIGFLIYKENSFVN
ncbi:carbonic anhydrase 2-like [Microplitis demolitor]|uniref:carbonic anhydrase 2-like n=1 Tax=Microplitis demolitor TaxID=69319 RepID=UPI0006D4E74F|nr:carbonic anhydrase 2-like [Microplitis demolitor]